MPRLRRSSVFVLTAGVVLAVLLATASGCRGLSVTTYYERGCVATADPIASAVGAQIFRRGGNAVDAAVAIGFTLAVVYPEAGNIGGGGFGLVRTGSSGQIRAIDFRETAPRDASVDMYLDSAGNVIDGLSLTGALAGGVPGTVAGLHELWRTYGSMEWEELVAPAAALADTGFIVGNHLAGRFQAHADALRQFPSTVEQFFSEGRPLIAGERWRQKDLARTLYSIASEGPAGFYEGETAEAIVFAMSQEGGLISLEDLAGYRPVWREPIHVTFDSLDVYSMPPPSSGGALVGQILELLEPFDFSRLGPTSPEYIHLFAEASRLAFADRSRHFGDPAFYPVPTDNLLDPLYLNDRRTLIIEGQATRSSEIAPGHFGPAPESDQTTHFSVIDSDGSMVAITYTLNTEFGSKLVVDGCGFLLNNEMDDFAVKPGVPNVYGLIGDEANKIEPGKRMLSSMSPTLVLGNGKPLLALGAPGGSRIITTVAEAIINFSRFHVGIDQLVAQPRFHHQWLPDTLFMESNGFAPGVIAALQGYGHTVVSTAPYSDLHVVHMGENGLLSGASDPRRRGAVDGF